MPATVVDAVKTPFPCACACHERLSLDERAAGIEALYRFDDAMRGWNQTVIWDLAAPTLWKLQKQLGEVKWVAVRESGCIHARLLGFCVHELIHAMCGDPTLPNFGTPVGLPYGVPIALDPKDAETYINRGKAYAAKGDNDRAIADYGPDEIRLMRRCQVMATKVFDPDFLRPVRVIARNSNVVSLVRRSNCRT